MKSKEDQSQTVGSVFAKVQNDIHMISLVQLTNASREIYQRQAGSGR